MPYFCAAAQISWALMFGPVPGDSLVTYPHNISCFAEQWVCEAAERAANAAFAETHEDRARKATCEAQPAEADQHASGAAPTSDLSFTWTTTTGALYCKSSPNASLEHMICDDSSPYVCQHADGRPGPMCGGR